jgi:Ala-tRNA(Pro) deacylase
MENMIKEVTNLLEELNIKYRLYNHKAVFTIDELDTLDIKFEGMYCKNLFLRNSKGDIHYLLILEDSKKANLKELARYLNSTRLSFASDERLNKYLGLKPGSVTPFGVINDSKNEVIVLLDKDLVGLDKINFHPNTNTATITISYSDLIKFLEYEGNRVDLVEI